MNATDTWTIGRLLTWTTEFLKKNGSSSPRLDCEVLLAHARQCQRIELYTAFAEDPGEEVRAAFREMVRRRAEGTPVAYLVGYKEFYSERFEVNPDVLIPRPETEHLIVEALDRARQIQDGRGKGDERQAEAYDEEVSVQTQKVTSLLEPLLIVGMAFVVGFIVISVMLPILKISDIRSIRR